MPSQKRTLFLGDLSLFCTEQDLELLFGAFGEIYEIRLKRDAGTLRNLSYGFIKFVVPACATLALESLDGYFLHGRALR
jgi:RNA recognition motif-containing protein